MVHHDVDDPVNGILFFTEVSLLKSKRIQLFKEFDILYYAPKSDLYDDRKIRKEITRIFSVIARKKGKRPTVVL